MKRSEFTRRFNHREEGDFAAGIAEEAGVVWDPEWPEGFEAFWLDPSMNGLRVKANQYACLAAWNACLSRQEAQERTNEPEVDPEVRRKEIEALIEAWADFQVGLVPTGMTPMRDLWAAAGRGLVRNYLHVEGY